MRIYCHCNDELISHNLPKPFKSKVNNMAYFERWSILAFENDMKHKCNNILKKHILLRCKDITTIFILFASQSLKQLHKLQWLWWPGEHVFTSIPHHQYQAISTITYMPWKQYCMQYWVHLYPLIYPQHTTWIYYWNAAVKLQKDATCGTSHVCK